jgi:5'-nucleotidase
MRILVTNDDGYSAEGISVVVQQLQTLPDVELTVVAPAANQSGKSDTTTPGTLTATDGTTQDGFDAVGVEGTPADSVTYALDTLGLEPDLVVSGINAGQNVGPLVDVSGTVGAARTASRRGIPSLAVSQSITGDAGTDGPDLYTNAGVITKDWVAANRDRILRQEKGTGTVPPPVKVVTINVPNCGAEPVRGVAEVPTATDMAGRSLTVNDCSSTAPDPKDDVDALATGYASQSTVGLQAGELS